MDSLEQLQLCYLVVNMEELKSIKSYEWIGYNSEGLCSISLCPY